MWVLVKHPDTDALHLIADTAVGLFEARGWARRDLPAGMDADDPNAPAALDECLAEEARIAESEPAAPAKKTKAVSATDEKE